LAAMKAAASFLAFIDQFGRMKMSLPAIIHIALLQKLISGEML
jgi:hypothetical protein